MIESLVCVVSIFQFVWWLLPSRHGAIYHDELKRRKSMLMLKNFACIFSRSLPLDIGSKTS